MKKIIILALVFCLTGIYAAEQTAKKTESSGWDFFTFTFVPGVPPAEDVFDVYGMKCGIPIGVGANSVHGIELSIFASMTAKVSGLQSAVFFDNADTVNGVQASFIYNNAKKVHGLQFSLINVAEDTSFQIGLLNFIKNSPLKCFPFINCRF